MPSFQPIELVWEDTKNYVAKQYQTGRSFENILSDDQIRSWEVDCNKLVKHCRRSINSWISQDKVLSANLEKYIVPENYQRELESFNYLFLSADEIEGLKRDHNNCVNIIIDDDYEVIE